MMNSDITQNTEVRIMPDVHFGKGSTIGTTIQLPESQSDWKVSPNVVGVDIGCGMMSYKLANFDMSLDKFDELVSQTIPSGKSVHTKILHDANVDTGSLTIDLTDKEEDYIRRSLGTLGGGNHFIELAVDENGEHWLTVHSGSMKLGHMVATHHQKVANFINNHPDNSVHNFIDIQNGIIRKGATSAEKDERLIIPLSMRDGSLICAGKGNADWNFSAPHGAGRMMSRTQAKKKH